MSKSLIVGTASIIGFLIILYLVANQTIEAPIPKQSIPGPNKDLNKIPAQSIDPTPAPNDVGQPQVKVDSTSKPASGVDAETLNKIRDALNNTKNNPCTNEILSECMSKLSYPVGDEKLNRCLGSLVGLAVGDALGAQYEFMPPSYLKHILREKLLTMNSGGTWGFGIGKWTDDTSMALCLAASLICKQQCDMHDQLVRYCHWWESGYFSSTGTCFDIGSGTKGALAEFKEWIKVEGNSPSNMTSLLAKHKNVGGNGSLMRLAPIPIFYHRKMDEAIENAKLSSLTTHGLQQAVDACMFYSALIAAAINGVKKDDLLSPQFCKNYPKLQNLHSSIKVIAEGSYKSIHKDSCDWSGNGFSVVTLKQVLWAFYNDDNNIENGLYLSICSGNDTDTVAAIYCQFAGACYGYDKIPKRLMNVLYKHELIKGMGLLLYELGPRAE